ncbi:hypothetical protein ABZ547_07175 [Streptomyces sparsogenes]|uniref:hypothetical protein n=1 Tax=Streptomyces sparsogenes TaxID=67365 RepID=UPI0033CE58A7
MSARPLPPPPPDADPDPDAPAGPDADPDAPAGPDADADPGTHAAPGAAAARDADRAALLAERTEELRELTAWYLARRRALLLWLATGLVAAGWAAAWAGCRYVAAGDVVSVALGVFLLALAAGLAVPSALAVASGARDDLEARERLRAWARSARDRDTLARWHSPGRALFWLLPSLVLCCFGSASAAMTAAGDGSALTLGLAVLLAGTGALGMVKAVGYYRLVSRELTPVPEADEPPHELP